jgi:hypothetical protein
MKSPTGDTVTSPASTVVDEATEACLYRLPRERLAGTTAFSVGYWRTLAPFHARHCVVQPNGSGPASIVEVAAVTGCRHLSTSFVTVLPVSFTT